MGKKKAKGKQQFGHQPPQHDFFLNPYSDVRFTRCPKCDGTTKLSKKPPLIEMTCLQHYPQLIGHDYLIVGTMERKSWREGHHKASDLFETLHDFKQHLEFKPARYSWAKEG